MVDGNLDGLSVSFGALQTEVKHLLGSLSVNRKEDLEHRSEVRELMHGLGDRVGTLEHKVGDIYPVVQDMKTRELKKQAIKDYQAWQLGLAAGLLSTLATIAYTYVKSTGGG